LEIFKKVLEILPTSDRAKLYLAKIHFQQKSYTEALEVTKTRLNPYDRDFFDLAVDILTIINQ
jgi:cytochrome c-type biogenesis protein CcmH/NrfG